MNNEWMLILTEFLINYWLHSTLFAGLTLIAFRFNWIKSDRRGEIIAKSALLLGLVSSLIFTSGWRFIEVKAISFQYLMDVKAEENKPEKLSAVESITPQTSITTKVIKQTNKRVIPVTASHQENLPAIRQTDKSEFSMIDNVNWQFVLFCLWLLSMFVLLVIRGVGIFRLHQLLSDRRTICSEKIQNIYQILHKRLDISFPITLSESNYISSPIIFGKEEIILPVNFSTLYTKDQIEVALAHEIAHLIRKDSLWRKIFLLVDSIFFIQPLNKLLVQKLNHIAEHQSDRLACQWTGHSIALAEALAITAQNNFNSSQSQWVPAMKSDKSQLLVRIEALLSKNQNSSSLFSMGFGALLTVFVLTTMPGLSINLAHAGNRMSHSDNMTRMTSTNDQDGIETTVKAKLKGQIIFNDEETEILQFPEDSKLDITYEEEGEDERRLLIRRKGDDAIEYIYYVDNEKQTYDADAKKWFASVLPHIFRVTGIDAKGRVARIKNRGGDSAVLEEAKLIKSDFVQGVYLKELYAISQLNRSDIIRALEITEDISSDFEMSNVLETMAKTQKFDSDGWNSLFETGTHIQSDFEMAGFLKVTIGHISDDGDAQKSFFEAAKSIQSDFEMRGLFSHFLSEKNVSSEFLIEMLSASESIQSDFELASLLMLTNKQANANSDIFEAYLKASENISSDFEMSRTYISFTSKSLDNNTLVALIEKGADNISSDFEFARLLTHIIDTQDVNSEVKSALVKAAKTIGSSFERERVLLKLV